MDKKLILFDNTEKIRGKISNIFKNIIFPSSINDLESVLKEENLLITEFRSILPCSQEDLLNVINKYSPATIIHTNSDLYKKYLEEIEKARVSYVIEKSLVSIRHLEKAVNKLLKNPVYTGTIIIPKLLPPKNMNYSPIDIRNEWHEKKGRHVRYDRRILHPTLDSK